MYENNISMRNDIAVCDPTPSMSIVDKTHELHTMVLETYTISNDIYAILFSFGNRAEDPEKPESVNCLSDDLDFIGKHMKKTLDLLAEIKNRIG